MLSVCGAPTDTQRPFTFNHVGRNMATNTREFTACENCALSHHLNRTHGGRSLEKWILDGTMKEPLFLDDYIALFLYSSFSFSK